MSAAENLEKVRRFIETFNQHASDPTWLDQSVADVSDSVAITNMATGEVFRGTEGARQFEQAWAQAFPDSRVQITNIAASDDQVVVEFTGRGTQTGPLVGPMGTIPPTGKQVEVPFCHVITMDGDKISTAHFYFDALGMLTQLGVIPAPATANVQAKQP